MNITFSLTDDDVALEEVERFFVDLTLENPASGVLVTQPDRTEINVLDDDGEKSFLARIIFSHNSQFSHT